MFRIQCKQIRNVQGTPAGPERTQDMTRFIKIFFLFVLLLMCFLIHRTTSAQGNKDFVLVIRMMGIQDAWFREHLIPPFEKAHGVNVTVASFDRFWDLEVMLTLDRQRKSPSIGLVKTPLEMTRPLKHFMRPFDGILRKDALEALKAAYDPAALEKGMMDGKLYYLPRKLETRIMVYATSKVTEAVAGWQRFEQDISDALSKENGFGLPSDYTLESDPNQWDYFDLFVAAWYWSRTPYYGITLPRMGHRGKKYGGTVVGLVDRIFQMGGTAEDVLQMDSRPVVDMFLWEALFRKNGLYNPGMWQDPWSGGGIWNAMKDGKVYLAMMHQIDCFFIHGGTHPQMQGYLTDPDDMGVAVMPRGVSLELDSNGQPSRMGSRRAGTSGWWWGIPQTAPDPHLSAALAQWITGHENHRDECRIFGMMPIRRDITANLKGVFPKAWMARVFDTSVRQLMLNGDATAPLLPEYSEIGKIYLAAWYDIVVKEHYGSGGKIDRTFIKKRLEDRYVPKIRAILGDRYSK